MTENVLPSIAILGPGGIGGFLSAVFWKAGFPVTCVARPERAEEITKNGIELQSAVFGTYIARPRAVISLDIAPRILFMTTKATGLKDAIDRIDPDVVGNAVIIPLLNGVEHMEILRKFFPRHVMAGTISIEAYEASSGHIVHATQFARIRLAGDEKELGGQLSDIAGIIQKTGIAVEMGTSEAQILWEKLVRLNALALATGRYKKPIGQLRSDEGTRNELKLLVQEAVDVATQQGALINVQDVMGHMDRLEPTQFSSLKRDLDVGKESELDAIAGAIIRVGNRHGLVCPTIKIFLSAIKTNASANH